MRNLIKSSLSFAWGMTLLGARSLSRLVGSNGQAGSELDSVARAAEGQLEEPLKGVYQAADRGQSEIVDRLFDTFFGGSQPDPGTDPPPHHRGLDPSVFVTLGDGLSAGMGHFSLEGSAQETSFPALLARSLGTSFAQPLMQAPGLGDIIGLEPQNPIVPGLRQSTVRGELPSQNDLGNLSVPGLGVADALHRTPTLPLVDRSCSLQTLTNFVLGMPDLIHGGRQGKTQIQYAQQRGATLALVCHGYDDVLRGAVHGETRHLPRVGPWRSDLSRLLRDLGDHPVRIVTTVPDPLHSAWFSNRDTAATILKTTPAFLEQHWGVAPTDHVHLPGLYSMGYQMMARRVGPLESPATINEPTAATIQRRVDELNAALGQAATAAGVHVFDLHGLLRHVAQQGIHLGPRTLTCDYLGGLYLLNGLYPGPTLNAIIAAAMVRWINQTFDGAFDEPSVAAIAANDANTQTELAPGPPSTDAFLRPRSGDEVPDVRPLPPAVQEIPIQTTYPNLQPNKVGCTPAVGIPAAGMSDPSYDNPHWRPLQVPPEGLSYSLDINPQLSFFGDALRPVDCPNDPPLIPNLPPFGLCENIFFGGLLPTTSQLRGKINVEISPPDAQGISRFEIRHPGGLHGGEGDLVGPQLFRMPIQHTVVRDIERLVSRGELHLQTGLVTNFHYNVQNMNTALHALLKLNPGVALPALEAAALTFPGLPNAGSSWIEFTPRHDGKLDVSLAGQMFVPFGLEADGKPVRFALPFATPDLTAASFVARGTSLHPRIFVTTQATPTVSEPARTPDIPFNSVVEMTSFSRHTFFGDAFGLHAPELGEGGAMGRSQLLSRIRVQFGARTGDTVPVVLQMLPPGGLLNDAPQPPPFLPPGLSRGAVGFDTVMHFPKQTYPQSGLASPDDPFNICATSVHLGSGAMVSPLLWRGYVVQALFADLIQVEPCTPADSFNYQGPARFERDANGQLVLRWNGTVFLPYPKGFKFPSPNPGGRPPFVIQADSRLDPFRSVQAMVRPLEARGGGLRGAVHDAQSPSTGVRFSYLWDIPFDPKRAHDARFEYTDHAQGATFRLTALSWVDFTDALGASSAEPGIVTFSGFGTWSADPSGAFHQVSAQISVSPHAPFVGIQIDGGLTSNVDIKPQHKEDA